jgi:hypothetical protein
MSSLRSLRIYVRLVLLVAVVTFSVAAPNVALAGAGPASASDPPRYTDAFPAIGVAVVSDGLDSGGKWTQTLRLTIKSGGSLSDVSLVVYGDLNHVNAIYAAARKANPRVLSPALVPVGQQFDLPIDPTTTFALTGLLHRPNALVQSYSNGVVDTIYGKAEGNLVRVIEFPDGKPTEEFNYSTADGEVRVRSGGKIVDVVHAEGASFGDTVRQVFGATTYLAAADLTKQTGWSPTTWPPATADAHRIVVGPPSTYTAMPPEVMPILNPDAIGHAREDQVRAARRQVGITLTRLESFEQIYHVAVNDPSLKASDVSRLLYGTDAHRISVAAAAGIPAPSVGNAAFDPHLFGRAFDLAIDYVDEAFVVKTIAMDNGIVEVQMADGASVVNYPAAASGPLKIVRYPTGYKRVFYRPPPLLLNVANGLALFHAANNLTLPSTATAPLDRRYAAEVIWRWGPAVPRQSGDLTDSIDLVDDPRGAYVDALVAPPLPRTTLQRLVDALDSGNPFVAIGALVVAASMLVVMADGLRRLGSRRRLL